MIACPPGAANRVTHIRGIVTSRRDVTGELWIVRVQPEAPLSFVPGQYFTVGLLTGSKMVERPYSVASAPGEPELEFFLEEVPEGKLTPHLHDVPVGGEVWLRPAPKGRFFLEQQTPNHFMAATVTGVAPFVSMVRDLDGAAEPVPYRIAILHAASFAPELAYSDELSGLATRESWFRYVPVVSRAWLDAGWMGERGRVEDVARKHLDALGFAIPSTTAYLCGNPNMIRAMEGVLERAGFAKNQIRKEVYWPAG